MKSVAFIAFTLLVSSRMAHAQDRVALLIVNTDYGSHKASVDVAGIAELAKSLESAGFTVTYKENIQKDFRKELEAFALTCPDGGVSLLYFAGFGNRFEQKMTANVVKPDGSKEKLITTKPDSGIWPANSNRPNSLSEIAKTFRERSCARLNLLFFDCATASPLAKSAKSQGLFEVDRSELPAGAMCFAMPPEKVLPAGTASKLARSLARNMGKEDTDLDTVMKNVRDDVAKQSGGKQDIWFKYGIAADKTALIKFARPRNINTGQFPPANPKPGDEWINSIGMVFCWCPPGSFRMGIENPSFPQAQDANPVKVTISEGFWVSKYELTNGDYYKMRRRSPDRNSLVTDANVPMTLINGPGAVQMGPKTLSPVEKKAGRLPDGWEYRLPTEAEWEYACRAGASTAYSFGDSSADLFRYANYADARLFEVDDSFYYCDRSANDGVGKRPAPVGRYKPNAWGIHDMHGNVAEFVLDRYTPVLPGGTDPLGKGEEKNNSVVYRGGAWCSLPEYCLAGFRQFGPMSNNSGKTSFIGVRLVLAKAQVNIKDKKNK